MHDEETTCALVAASDFNAGHFTMLHSRKAFQRVIAVDAGYGRLIDLGISPDLAIGDFDSLGYVPQGGNVEVYPAHKDKSDLELGFDAARAAGVGGVFVYGALGGRLDHSLANLQMCARFAEAGMTVTLVAPGYAVRILVGPGRLELPVRASGVVSVFAATDIALGVAEIGLEYPLDNARLSNRTTLGLSNELIGKPASISVEQGTLYVFYPLDER